MTTTLYLHAATSTVTGTLPSTQQSTQSVTVTGGGEDVTANKTMDTTVGTSQVSIATGSTRVTSNANAFVARFVSLPLSTTSISANTWTVSFGRKSSRSGADYAGGSTGKVPAALFIWRPSTGAKISAIFDTVCSNTSAVNGTTTEKSSIATYTGSAGTAAVGDVLIYEQLGAIVTPGTSSSGTFYYDGTTAQASDNVTVSDIASNISTPQTLSFGSAPIVASTTPVIIRNKYITKH
jgi:hypothetical protein